MKSKYGEQNNVKGENQIPSNEFFSVYEYNGEIKVLFIGNSITRHGPLAEIGWSGNWGMAASKMENDYVHQVVNELKKKCSVAYAIAQCANWEKSSGDEDVAENILNTYFASARDFDADIIVVRIGENVQRDANPCNLKVNFNKMIKFFNKNKRAKVIITSLFWYNTTLDEIIKDVAEENKCIYCDISDLGEDEKNMAIGEYEYKGICMHPNDLGMKNIAERILKCIE